MEIKKGQKSNLLVWGVLILISLYSCDKNKVFEKYISIPNNTWNTNEPVVFEFEVQDTTQYCNLFINIRSSEDYPYRNMYMFMKTTRPDGSQSLDTMEFYFLDVTGKPLGKCSGTVCNNKFLIDREFKFPQPGKYIFELKQAMRTEDGNLPLILDVGMRVEKTSVFKQ